MVLGAPIVAAVTVKAEAGNEFFSLQANAFGGYNEGADEGLLAHLHMVHGG